ncbi:PilZ domain-containing protein [Hahella ganghwensis]|uniref:PilZ domain-containing protein n=1 Tax=Hahella ganghwensis TaxID=286420 RepID=UPI0003A890FE|nr:PilZ domain-containing protein [Hahella ganghwensis]
MTPSTATQMERRRVRRIPAIELQTNIREKKGLFGETWSEVRAMDFTHSGVCIDSDRPLNVGQIITLSFYLKMEIGEIKLEKVQGEVKHVKFLGSLCRCGVEFSGIRAGSEQEAQLTRLESLLSRHQSVVDRI